MILEIIFWFLAFLVFHTYIFYPFILYILSELKKKNLKVFNYQFYPSVSLIIAAHNEEDVIEQKILNSLELNYPKDKLEILIVDDGSEDKTAAIVSKYKKRVKLLKMSERGGKLNAINTAVSYAKGEIVFFSDANTFYKEDVIARAVEHFNDVTVGCVTGYVKLIPRGGSHKEGEGFYSKYEKFIQTKESEISSVIGIDGAMYAMRKKLYRPLKNLFIEDFVMGMNVIKQDHRVIYDKKMFGWEESSKSMRDELKRKSRVVAGGFQCTPRMGFLLKKPMVLFQFISHKFLRWIVPEILIALLIINWFLLDGILYQNIFVMQLLFYMIACMGFLFGEIRMFSIPYYFLMMNISGFWGFIKYITGTQKVTWKMADR